MKDKNELKAIEYEGEIIAPKSGVYRCPNKCGAKGYPAPKWKTEKGFIKHLDACFMRSDKVKARGITAARVTEKKKKEESDNAELSRRMVAECPRKIGDGIHFVYNTEVKPTHEQRGSRMVRVRYEAVVRSRASHVVVYDIQWVGGGYLYNTSIRESDIFGSMKEAMDNALDRTRCNEEYRKQSSQLR